MNPFAICRSLGVQTFLWKHKSSSLLLGHKNVEEKINKNPVSKNNLFPKLLVIVLNNLLPNKRHNQIFDITIPITFYRDLHGPQF